MTADKRYGGMWASYENFIGSWLDTDGIPGASHVIYAYYDEDALGGVATVVYTDTEGVTRQLETGLMVWEEGSRIEGDEIRLSANTYAWYPVPFWVADEVDAINSHVHTE